MELSIIYGRSPARSHGIFPRGLILPATFHCIFPPNVCFGRQIPPLFLVHCCNFSSKRSEDHIFMLGMGFVGQYFADQLKKEGWKVSGTWTSETKKKHLEGMGFNMFQFEASDPELRCLSTLQNATHILVSIPPIVNLGDPVLHLHLDTLRSKLSNTTLRWVCYLSSTGVYGDCRGAWVDEDYPTNPMNKSAIARLAAEKGWLDLGHDLGVSVRVFRLGGIYGPGRSALDTIINQKHLSEDQKIREFRRFTARVHVADICQAMRASMDKLSSGKIYNVVDDDPAPRAEVFSFARALLLRKWPQQFTENPVQDSMDPVIQYDKNITGEKRVSNERLKKELGVKLIHPTYRSGLQSIAESMENPFKQF